MDGGGLLQNGVDANETLFVLSFALLRPVAMAVVKIRNAIQDANHLYPGAQGRLQHSSHVSGHCRSKGRGDRPVVSPRLASLNLHAVSWTIGKFRLKST